ncbi:MAG: Zn-dependent hydrolase [Flavobacteriaceae bacterium]
MKYPFLLLLVLSTSLHAQQIVEINSSRVNDNLQALKQFGLNAQQGNDRVAYSDHERNARSFLIEKLQKLGLTVNIDQAGNLSARRPGRDPQAPIIAFGSHIDAVPNGGHYDGNVGSIGALEVMETLVEKNIQTTHPFELLIFTNEEGGVFGSRALAGEIKPEALAVVTASGYTNAEGVQRIGGDPENIEVVIRKPEDLHAFMELHIEQGSTLYDQNIAIGVVEGIVGLKWWDVTINGFANHAGTTPMNRRKDAMLAAAEFTLMVNRVIKSYPGRQVGTVGRIAAFPGAPNVIPGKVVLSLEIRDLDSSKIARLFEHIQQEATLIGEQYNTSFNFSPIDATSNPALTDPRIQQIIRDQADRLGLSHIDLPSGAGHDAQDMALLTPTGMIFIPSVDGISHSPQEYSTPEAIAQGTELLLNTLLEIDRTPLGNQ